MKVQRTEGFDGPYVSLRDVSKTFVLSGDSWLAPQRRLIAVNSVDLDVFAGETLALVGESGCGKSTLARLIMHLETPSSGTISIQGQELTRAGRQTIREARRKMQMVFQDPQASLNPRMTARQIISEPLRNYRPDGPAEVGELVSTIAGQVGLREDHLERYPHELSGGQCQRVGIARAIILEPELVVADEPVSALDVSIQAQILNLILRLKEQMRLTLVLVSHDLSVVEHLADRVAVMYLGRIIEIADRQTLFSGPAHPYTQMLLAAVPRPVPAKSQSRKQVRGELPDPMNPPDGCPFRERCRLAVERCATETPPMEVLNGGRQVACHQSEISLSAWVERADG